MNKDYTHITFLLDRSGSMEKVKNDTIGGFNNFIAEQKKIDKPATMSLYQFDDRFEPNYLFKSVNEIDNLNEDTFRPRGWTSLFDAIGRSIVETGEALNKLNEENKPNKIVFVIQTDGEENRSKEFNFNDITKLVKQQSDQYHWEFVFLGAKLEAIRQAEGFGIKASNVMQYSNTARGMGAGIQSLSKNMASYRAGTKMDMSFEKSDRDEQEKIGLEKPKTKKMPRGAYPKRNIKERLGLEQEQVVTPIAKTTEPEKPSWLKRAFNLASKKS